MSALAKPMIHTTSATVNPSPMVNAERCTSVEKVDIPAVGNTPAKYSIVFTLAQDPQTGTVQRVEWNYATDSTTRDSDYAAVIVAISAAV